MTFFENQIMFILDEEVEALQAIYCSRDELEIVSTAPTVVLKFSLLARDSQISFSLTLEMDEKYPEEKGPCQMSLQCPALSRGDRDVVVDRIKGQATALIGM